jgi:hypothetical protein
MHIALNVYILKIDPAPQIWGVGLIYFWSLKKNIVIKAMDIVFL